MRRLVTALTVLFFAACSGPTGPDFPPDGPLDLALLAGGGQEVTVTDTLPSDILVQVTKGGVPLTDQLVDWKVLSDNCGSPFVTTTRTDSLGETGNRLVAGTRAWTRPDGPDTCQMEVRYALTVADTVQARVDTTVNYLVLPGPIMEESFDGWIFAGDTRDTIPGELAQDRYGNPGSWSLRPDCCVHISDSVPGSVGARTLVWDSAGIGKVSVVAGDSILNAGTVTTDTAGEIRTNFRN